LIYLNLSLPAKWRNPLRSQLPNFMAAERNRPWREIMRKTFIAVLVGLSFGIAGSAMAQTTRPVTTTGAAIDEAAREKALELCVAKAQTTVPSANSDRGDLTRRYAIYVDCMMAAGLNP
jgi:hypothetical protein